MNTYSSKFNKIELTLIKEYFESEGASFSTPQYMCFQARGEGFTASFYESGKFVIQGKRTAELVEKYFDSSVQSAPKEKKQDVQIDIPYPHIGVDESGKGDFFGPLVIAGAYLDENGARVLKELGICDSKKLNDKKILELEPKIKSVAKFDVIAISNKKYNELYSSFKNLNKLLAWGHSTVLENLIEKTGATLALCDKFADDSVIKNALKNKGKNIEIIQKTKAEADIAVAAASILARAEFVKKMSTLSRNYEINLPKGCNNLVLDAAKKIASNFSKEELKNVAKTHFKTYDLV